MHPHNHHHHHSPPPPPPPPHHHHYNHPNPPPFTTYHFHHQYNPSFLFNLNQEYKTNQNITEEDQEHDQPQHFEEQVVIMTETEHLFEKPLTPSDVGKLNRLVIPKQYAERYFPMAGDSGDGGLILNFEDEVGKHWRFRYSYWNSSQSYVLTKGWSRYVKEKQLDAGDVVLFFRHRRDCERLFIGWQKRGENGGRAWTRGGGAGYGGGRSNSSMQNNGTHFSDVCATTTDAGSLPQIQTMLTSAQLGNSKRSLRLFGVNLECQVDNSSEPSTPEGSTISSHGPTNHHHQKNFYTGSGYSSSSTTSLNYTVT